MEEVIHYIIKQELHLSELKTIIPKLKNEFDIRNAKGESATEELIDAVIEWENKINPHETLQSKLERMFTIKS